MLQFSVLGLCSGKDFRFFRREFSHLDWFWAWLGIGDEQEFDSREVEIWEMLNVGIEIGT